MHDPVDPPPGVSLVAIEVDFWNMVVFAVKAIAALLLAAALFGVVAVAGLAVFLVLDA